ncbi:hypothetical protein [Butyrivibrio sp. WCD2001]|uniref:hypothetical protein n=1 Tax=Butyrivibrio sp. WCD2001 TaxID=1280681 RepID=UPI0004296C0E|nr:hypothetical protein [Butyrivibrio sp. WCD2001]
MNTEEIKQAIVQDIGVPADLLTGESPEELIAQSKAYLAYKKDILEKKEQTPREVFKDWVEGRDTTPIGELTARLSEIETAIAPGTYPAVSDGGEIDAGSYRETPREVFARKAQEHFAYNPFKEGPWIKL